MKKVLLLIVTLLTSFIVINKVNAEELVKVYMFEAGGCPFCEKEMEYLESLDSYNKKFEVIRKELYVDHVNWEHGKDYDLGVKVANYFQSKGFTNASYTGTPFVVISDLYAAASYSTELEGYIEKAYQEGDKDIVGKFERDEFVEEKENHTAVIIAIVVILVGGLAALVVVANHDSSKK